MAGSRRKTVDNAVLHLTDGTAVKVTVGESDEGGDPPIRILIASRAPRVVRLWSGGTSESHVEVEIGA